jgi:hypothetical protein
MSDPSAPTELAGPRLRLVRFGWIEASGRQSNPFPEGRDGALSGFSEQRFELGKDLFDGVYLDRA